MNDETRPGRDLVSRQRLARTHSQSPQRTDTGFAEPQGLFARLWGALSDHFYTSKRGVRHVTEKVRLTRELYEEIEKTNDQLDRLSTLPKRLDQRDLEQDLDHDIAVREKRKRIKELSIETDRLDDEDALKRARIKKDLDELSTTGNTTKSAKPEQSVSPGVARARAVFEELNEQTELDEEIGRLKEQKLAEIKARAEAEGRDEDWVKVQMEKIEAIIRRRLQP